MNKKDTIKQLIISQIETCLNELGNKVLKRITTDDEEFKDFNYNPFEYMADVCDDLASSFAEIEESLSDEDKAELEQNASKFLDQLEYDDDEDDDIIKH